MVQGYYTLQEAAQVLGLAPEELKQMAQRNQIRSFQDRGTWRFRVQDIQELARQRGATSDMDLVLGDAPKSAPRQPKSGNKSSLVRSPGSSGTKNPKSVVKSPEVFDFAVGGGEEDFGLDLFEPSGIGAKPEAKKPDSGKPDSKKAAGPKDDDFGLNLLEPSDIGKPKSVISPKPKSVLSPKPKSVLNKPKSALAPSPASPPVGADEDFSLDLEPSDIKRKTSAKPPSPSPASPHDEDFGLDLFEVPGEVGEKKAGAKDDDFGLNLFESSGIKKRDSRLSPSSPKPSPPAGSESDVRLVAGGQASPSGLAPGSDSDVKLVRQADSAAGLPRTPAIGPSSPARMPASAPIRKSAIARKKSSLSPAPAPDSGVRLVPMGESDSDVKIISASGTDLPVPNIGATDSDIRLELPPSSIGQGSGEGMLTEEINLDEELKKQETLTPKPQAKVKPKSKLPEFPHSSPFELSDDIRPKKTADSQADSSDMELTPLSDKKHGDSSEDFSLDLPDDSDMSIDVGETNPANLAGPSSGISLDNPVDAGISLEEGSADLDFELSLDEPGGSATPRPSTPKPATPQPGGDSDADSEFELSLDVDDSSGSHDSLDSSGGDDSEFELTLDDGGLSPVEDEDKPQRKTSLGAAPKSGPKSGKGTKSKKKTKPPDDSDEDFEVSQDDSAGDKDIFDSDFEVPALDDDESGSQVAALDTDLDSSDFDLSPDDSELDDEESGSQVVALDEEDESVDEDDAPAKTKSKKQKPKPKQKKKDDEDDLEVEEELEVDEDLEVEEDLEVDEEGGGANFSDLEVTGDEETLDDGASAEEEEKEEVVIERVARPAPWGVVPTVLMLPCLIVMILVGIMGFEMVQHMTGYKPPGFLTKTFAELVGKIIK